MNNLKKLIVIIIFNLFLCLFPIFNVIATEKILSFSDEDLERLSNVILSIKKSYYKEINNKELINRAISGMVSSLDPHSAYLDSMAIRDLEVATRGKLGGIGVEVISEQGLIKVVSPLDDTPAYKAGIKAGDYIVQINNKFVRDMTSMDAVNMMRGKKGSLVSITIIRKNENKPLIFNIYREIIKIKTVKEKLLEPGYGYIKLVAFQDPTEKDMLNAIKKLRNDNHGELNGLILDMRNNPGGLVDSAVKIVDDFLDSKKLKNNLIIVSAKGQNNEEIMNVKATTGDILNNIPIIVLINDGSASAAEIVAGALQDHKRAIVVGTRSFGKGSMQTIMPIDHNGALKLTTALYFTPLGRSIQAKGIEPDINIEDIKIIENEPDDQSLKIDESSFIDHIQNINEFDIEHNDFDKNRKKTKDEIALAHKDYQLYEALHILKSQNIIK